MSGYVIIISKKFRRYGPDQIFACIVCAKRKLGVSAPTLQFVIYGNTAFFNLVADVRIGCKHFVKGLVTNKSFDVEGNNDNIVLDLFYIDAEFHIDDYYYGSIYSRKRLLDTHYSD